jgi:adenosylcobinamide-phosphate synthase
MVYKAINTLDSTFGYKNDRYLYFGWAAARLDDVANYLPARLTVPLMVLAAAILRLRPRDAWQICRRDGRKHPSPNSGLAEACAAGALGIQLGGVNYYFGEPSERPRMGEPRQPMAASDILLVNRLMLTTAVGFLAAIAAIRLIFIK